MANPKRQSCLPLSQTEDGSLATAPLSTVINAATNEAYQDFYNLIHAEIPIVSASGDSLQPTNTASAKSPGKEDATATTNNNNSTSNEVKKKRMSALSFAQRRHELTRRLFLHTKSISHIYALASSSLPNSHAALHLKTKPFPRLGATVSTSSDALKYVREAWVSADEAQDALYYHHDGLWRSRSHAHDVYGALCVLCGGYWPDFPRDVALAVDRYEHSKEKGYSVEELRRRLACGVRRKLVCGEVGEFGCCASGGDLAEMNDLNNLNQRDTMALPWKVTMESDGGAIRLTYGNPRIISTAEALRQQSMMAEKNDDNNNNNNNTLDNLQQYPMEARLSILSEATDAPWKLLSLRVQCSPKTGESDHQLHMNKKQMFDLHRIGERVMIVEEAICKKKENEVDESTQSGQDTNNMMEVEKKSIVPRPLLRLFEVTHSFALSMQIQMLSSQAEALRKGAWGGFVGIPTAASAGTTTSSNPGNGIAVSSAYFFDEEKRNKNDSTSPIAVMAVHFWSCDDRYGSPKIGDVNSSMHRVGRVDGMVPGEKIETASSTASISHSKLDTRPDDNFLPVSDHRGEKRLSLCIRAVPMVGLVVSLSGGSDYDASSNAQPGNSSAEDHHTKRNIDKLLSSIHDPFQLSMSDALLAATVLCAQRRCLSVVDALNRQKTNKLPSWIHLEVECGSITVAAKISYPSETESQSTRPYVILFRLACDSRTGRYIPVFSRSASLLRQLACHDPLASDVQALRSAAAANHISRIGGSSGRQNDGILREATGRIVRDAFEALTRSMDTLGRKCGVGGEWNDVDKQCASLREKSVDQSCRDVLISLMTCCGMSAVFGVGAIALKVTCGIDPAADM